MSDYDYSEYDTDPRIQTRQTVVLWLTILFVAALFVGSGFIPQLITIILAFSVPVVLIIAASFAKKAAREVMEPTGKSTAAITINVLWMLFYGVILLMAGAALSTGLV